MTDMKREGGYADRVQLAYAKTLDYVAHSVIIVMAAGYFLYLTGLLPLSVPIETIAGNWHLSASRLQAKLHLASGWSCFTRPEGIFHGDIVSYISVIFLSLATLICLVSAFLVFIGEKKRLYSAITLLQVIVLLVAASGILSAGR
ncbi:MAG: DUF1634 domain-containing protein [Chlorobiaceae bacterium]|nr:DUF1634 domain-containing protein [Chlorobiaceae bacterium]